jgi:hypothetical protein
MTALRVEDLFLADDLDELGERANDSGSQGGP